MKIWRYMDLAKFTSMIASKALYFASPNQFDDPFEGWLPRSYIRAFEEVVETQVAAFWHLGEQMREHRPNIPESVIDNLMRDSEKKLNVQDCLREVNLRFGINCWHMNEHQSAGMWKLYGAVEGGVAIVSSRERLEASLPTEGIIIDEVRYMDFDKDKIEKGHRHVGLFTKRHSFAHERELRATLLLNTPGEGTLVPCDLNGLIETVYISPLASPVYISAVRYIVERSDMLMKPKVVVSNLLDRPDY